MRKALTAAMTLLGLAAISKPAASLADDKSPKETEKTIEHLEKAQDQYNKSEFVRSAWRMRQASKDMTKLAEGASGKTKASLEHSITEFDQIATILDARLRVNEKILHDTFARAERNIASHHQERAKEAWSRLDAKKAGTEMSAAARYLESSATWTDEKLSQQTQAAIQDAKKVSEKLSSGAGAKAEEVNQALAELDKEISKASRSIASQKSSQ